MTDNTGPRRTELLVADLDAVPPIERAQLTRIELAPGQASGAHHHPCDVVGTVISGSIRFKVNGRDETVLHAGDPFFEPRDAYVLHFDNAADDQPAVFLACYLLSPGTTEVITMAPPAR
jgi:quercetin dioxygenase-like cupin family protein